MSTDNNTAGKEKQDGQEEFVMVEVDAQGKPLQGEAAGHDSEDDDDPEGLDDADRDLDDDDDEGEQRLGHSEDDETPEERKARRKRDRAAKRTRYQTQARAKDRLIESQGRMLLDLQEKVEKLQGRTVQYDINQIQTQLQLVQQQQADAKAVLIKLSKAGDHEGIAEISELQLNLRDQHRDLTEKLRRAKTQATAAQPDARGAGNGNPQPSGSPQVDPEVLRRAQAWAAANAWAHPNKADREEMAIIRIVDRNLHQEGWDPTTDEYWEELTARVKKRLPHHFKSKPNGSENRGGKVNNGGKPAAGGPRMAAASQNGARALGKNEVRVTPERKKAMQEAGMWDDPVKRNKMLAQYAKYDRENAA